MKKFKGFTLVECLVAMAILAIACMMLGAIEATVTRRNNFNHFNSMSLSNQMAYIEKYTNSDSVSIYYGGGTTPVKDSHADESTGDHKPPHTYVNSSNNKGTSSYVQIQKLDAGGSPSKTYSFPVDVYVMYSRDTKNVSSQGKDSDGYADTYGAAAGSFSTGGTKTNSDGENEENLRFKYLLGHTGT